MYCVCALILLGAESLIRHFQSCGIPLAICTGSSAHTYDRKISKLRDLFSGFSHAVCSDDPEVKNGKPSPDIYLVAAKRFTNHPESPANVSYVAGPGTLGRLMCSSLDLAIVCDSSGNQED